MFRSALQKIGNYLVTLSATPHPEPRTRLAAPRDSGNDAIEFERRTRRLAAARQTAAKGKPAVMVAGSVQFVGMEEIKRNLGISWHSVANIAYDIAEATIKKHLTGQDTFRRQDDETFILVFGTSDKSEAEATTRAIVAEIQNLLAERSPDTKLRIDHTVAELDWAPIESGAEPIISSIASALRKIRLEVETSAAAWRQHLVQNAALRYSAMWNPSRRAVASYRVLLDDETGRQVLERLGVISNADDLKMVLFELDCLIIGRAIEALHKLLDRGGKVQILIPVNFSTVFDRGVREQYIKLCQNIPQSYTKFVLFHLHGAMAGTPAAHIAAIGLALKQHSRGVLVEIPIGAAQIQFAATSFHGISIDAKSLPGTVSDATQRLLRSVAAARIAGLKVFVHGADTVGAVEAAANAHVDYVEGRGVAVPCLEPKNLHELNPRCSEK